jgi:hypothetical protein
LKEQLEEDNHIRIIIHGVKNTKSYDPEDQFDNHYKLQRDYPGQLEVHKITSDVYDGLNVFISDRETIAIIELNKPDNNKLVPSDDIFDKLGLATHLNSESTVSSYATIFDTLWIRSTISTGSQNYNNSVLI